MNRSMERINRRFYNDVIEAVDGGVLRLNKTDKTFIEKNGRKLDEEVGLTRRERETLDQIHDLIRISKWW